MDSKHNFDELQGGSNFLPRTLSIMKFTAARIEEIKSMREALKLSSSTKLAFQTLPKHMRRRIMSHNPKRVPREMRTRHVNQMSKSGLSATPKKITRKHRRRPRNLQDEYMRRQRKISWLETHIWHAKRFHMVNRWGYRLPEQPCDKVFRACYRAIAHHCLLQDISYISCVSITGPLEILLENFKNICDSSSGVTFAAKAFIRGTREGQTTLFFNNSNPKRAIGTVNFMWNPITDSDSEEKRTIWIWIHAAFYNDALNTLIECFSLNTLCTNNQSKIYKNENSKIFLEELKFDLSRFRLTGPLSTAILQKILKLAHLSISTDIEWDENFLENPDFEESVAKTSNSSNSEITRHLKNTLIENSKWFKQLLDNFKSKKILNEQETYWKTLEGATSPDQVSPHVILSLIATDPRYSYPKKREKALPIGESNSNIKYEIPENVNKSWLWNKDIRNQVFNSKLPTKIINDLRSDLLVPGSDLHHCGAPIPVLLVQQPGCTNEYHGFGSGWDLIVPSGWGQPFWVALIMRGARSGGLREFNSLLFECERQQFLPPDTKAGAEEEKRLSDLQRRKYFARPPNKRPNYRKLSITNPFGFQWKDIVQNWSSNEINDFYVIRSKKMLEVLQNSLKHKRFNDCIDINLNCLVPVRIKMLDKGAPKIFAVICLPHSNDNCKKMTLMEPLKEDLNEQKRKDLRSSHKMDLKKRSKERKKLKKKRNSDSEKLESYRNEIEKLWLPDSTKNVRFSSSREVIGFVTKAQFSFTRAKNCANGYIALGAFQSLVCSSAKVLVRNVNSLQYRFGIVNVIV
ncbi:ribonucleases P/MRP protein subunit POP1 isoform X2 [Agrilus planipennis]|uniref:Ribonucleases P/MRP protein subunit POP1 isoform X2 n=1 Tax=Agrilus planipennis TaxID=224129 RepID=A0A7F5QZ01_AGRPL|nr:ribonucleases P/MRP protein subunit POP1 isoform X2 [Agrilus planipennis]